MIDSSSNPFAASIARARHDMSDEREFSSSHHHRDRVEKRNLSEETSNETNNKAHFLKDIPKSIKKDNHIIS